MSGASTPVRASDDGATRGTAKRRERRRILRVALVVGVLGVAAPLIIVEAEALAHHHHVTPAAADTSGESVREPVDGAAVVAAIERLRREGMWLNSADAGATAQVSSPALATAFGKALFRGILTNGGSIALDELLSALGYGMSDPAQALREVREAIESLNLQVQAIAEKIEQLLDGQDRINFYNSYTASGKAANRLTTALASVEGWIAAGANPSPSDLSDMQTIVRGSISDLSFTSANPTTGTVPLLMKAVEPSGVSDLKGYWTDIDVARDDYRAVLGEGLLTLDRMLRWDTTGTIAADLATLTPIATDTVRALYGYGVEVNGPGGAPFVQLRDSDALSKWQSSIPTVDRDVWRTTTGSTGSGRLYRTEVEPLLQGMAASYRPALEAGKTLEAYLRERGVPGSVAYTDTVRSDRVERTSGSLTKTWSYVIRVVLGEIKGNSYTARTVDIVKLDYAYREDWTPWNGWTVNKQEKAEADKWASSQTSFWRTAAQTNSQSWQDKTAFNDHTIRLGDYSGRIVIGAPDNGAGGFMVDQNSARVEAAAFGT